MPTLNDQGIYELSGSTSTEPYSGRYRSHSAFIVGYGTEYQKLFTPGQRKESKRYAEQATDYRLAVYKLAASQLPEDVGIELFGE